MKKRNVETEVPRIFLEFCMKIWNIYLNDVFCWFSTFLHREFEFYCWILTWYLIILWIKMNHYHISIISLEIASFRFLSFSTMIFLIVILFWSWYTSKDYKAIKYNRIQRHLEVYSRNFYLFSLDTWFNMVLKKDIWRPPLRSNRKSLMIGYMPSFSWLMIHLYSYLITSYPVIILFLFYRSMSVSCLQWWILCNYRIFSVIYLFILLTPRSLQNLLKFLIYSFLPFVIKWYRL